MNAHWSGRRRERVGWSVLLLIAIVFAMPMNSRAAEDGSPILLTDTGHTLAYQFRMFYERHGGEALFGPPLTEVFLQHDRPVQYFTNARMEWHAETLRVELGHLGRWLAETQHQTSESAFAPVTSPSPGAQFFPETQHTLSAPWLQFWHEHGGVETFGYPISEPFALSNDDDGGQTMVQYFERTRLDYHPAPGGSNQIRIMEVGRAYLDIYPAPIWATAPVETTDAAWAFIRPMHITIPRIGVQTDITSTAFSGDGWEVPRYSAAHYWQISGYPGTGGNIILAGHVGYAGIIFHTLPEIELGDDILVEASGRLHRYTVHEIHITNPDDTWILHPTPTETLTLITCVPIGVYSHRFVVRALPTNAEHERATP